MVPDPNSRLFARLQRPQFGFGFKIDLASIGSGSAFDPKSLFSNGEQGFWYDPSDLSTQYTDNVGTTPASAGGPVGLVLDKSKGLVRGAELFESGVISAASWLDLTGGVPASTVSGDQLTFGGQFSGRYNPTTAVVGALYEFKFEARLISGNSTLYAYSNGTALGATNSRPFAVTASWQPFTFLMIATSTGFQPGIQDRAASGWGTVEVRNLSCKQIAGNHIWAPSNTNRVTLTQSGGLYYWVPDGNDDYFVSGNVDFSASDKLTVLAALRKQSDVSYAAVIESSADPNNTNGAFALGAPGNGGTASFGARVRGTTQTGYRADGFAAPVSAVLSASFNIGGAARASEVSFRVNGADHNDTGTDAADAGSGNFGVLPIYLFRRGGSSNPFGGNAYGLIGRLGQLSAAQIASAERWLGAKAGLSF